MTDVEFQIASVSVLVAMSLVMRPLSPARFAAVMALAVGLHLLGMNRGVDIALAGVDRAIEEALEEQDNLREGRSLPEMPNVREDADEEPRLVL